MKFGKNLVHLSIPEWKVYNLDYNDLKATIREATRNPSADLSTLYQKFIENFDYLNLFVTTKSGELARKLRASQREFQVIQNSGDETNASRLTKLGTLQHQIMNEISIELRKLTKFILVQKIAVKKIFKKFAKHYPDPSKSKKFISSLNQVLQSNHSSFINLDLNLITSQLLALLEELDRELKDLHELLHKKPIYLPLPHGQLQTTHSTSTIRTARSSIMTATSSPENVHIDAHVDLSIDQSAKFDLITKLKKNFMLLALVPKDIIARNDLSLSMHVYLNIPKLSDSDRICITYLTEGTNDETPSSVISYEHQSNSVVIAYTGGLRKYSYCCLPNSIIESIFQICNTDNKSLKQELEALLIELLNTKSLPAMAKLTINSLLSRNHSPSLRMVCDRTRYFVHKDLTQDNDIDVEDCNDSASPLDSLIGPESNIASTVDTKVYEDNYYMTFDENIFTSNSFSNNISFDTNCLDAFPFNMFNIHSNDSNLHNFEATLSTQVDGNIVQSNYKEVRLRKMPVKIQNFLKNTSVQLFKSLSIYDYMRSCYFNIIPEEQNNHYSRLLNINLLKNLENVEIVNNQSIVDDSIIQDKSRTIFKRQMSCKSLQDISLGRTPPLTGNGLLIGDSPLIEEPDTSEAASAVHDRLMFRDNKAIGSYHSYDSSQLVYLQKFNDLENLDFDDEDSYFVYLTFNNDLEDNIMNSIILSFIKFKHRMRRALNAFNLHDNGPTLWKTHKEKFVHERESAILNYDSINEDPTFLNSANDYQNQLVYDYDHVLSVVYFSLCLSALFISSIDVGIVYGLQKLQLDNLDVDVVNNPWMVFMLVFGYLFSLMFSMASINLNYQRFLSTSPAHSGILWAGFFMVTATVIWTIITILS